jgi:uncharacterized membrane protein
MNIDSRFRPSLVLGLGLGGFVDGIVFHQLLGWHHLICTTQTCQPVSIASLQRQNTQDGFFHLAVLALSITGVVWLFKTPPARDQLHGQGRILLGGALSGWGAFNLVEGLIDHEWLGLHHVLPDSPHWFRYDLLFLLFGLALLLGGWLLARSTKKAEPEAPPEPDPVT